MRRLQQDTIRLLWREVRSLVEDKKRESLKQQDKAARIIQKYWRGHTARKVRVGGHARLALLCSPLPTPYAHRTCASLAPNQALLNSLLPLEVINKPRPWPTVLTTSSSTTSSSVQFPCVALLAFIHTITLLSGIAAPDVGRAPSPEAARQSDRTAAFARGCARRK